jgi:glycosyltransferase involved in cell wall biosynthesis
MSVIVLSLQWREWSVQGQDCVRIAYVIDSFDVGGTELNAVRTAEALNRRKHVLTVFHLSDNGPLKARYQALGVDMLHVPISNLYSARTAAQGIQFANFLKKRRIDVVHTHDVYTNSFAIPWARLLTRCAVLASRRWTEDVPRAALKTINRVACGFAHRILVNSDSVASFLIRNERVPGNKIVTIRNFISDTAFLTLSETEQQKQREMWGVPRAAFVIGCVSRLAPVKNHAFLIRALAALPPQFHLVLIGGGQVRGDLESLAAALGVTARVHFTGEVLSERNLHQFFDVSVLVSRSEGFPNAIVEALAARRAVVATPVGGIPDLVKHESTGLIVEQDDVEMLAAHLSRLRQDTKLASLLGEAGCDMVRQYFHEDVVVAQIGGLYDDLATQARRMI